MYKAEIFLIPTIDNTSIASDLAGKRIFSVLDFKSGFWHMEPDKKRSGLTTFLTPFGRFKFLRVPFVLNCTPELFHDQMIKKF